MSESAAPPPSVVIFEVGPRDGLQNEPDVLAPEVRAQLVRRLVGSGIRFVEVASFVDPRRVPQMSGAEEVVSGIEREPGVVYAGLALNERGFERLVESARERGIRTTVTISVAFGCPFEGRVNEDRVLELVERVSEARPDTIVL